jgi:hypothetical protein
VRKKEEVEEKKEICKHVLLDTGEKTGSHGKACNTCVSE